MADTGNPVASLDEAILAAAKVLFPDDLKRCYLLTARILEQEEPTALATAVAEGKVLPLVVKAAEAQHDEQREQDLRSSIDAVAERCAATERVIKSAIEELGKYGTRLEELAQKVTELSSSQKADAVTISKEMVQIKAQNDLLTRIEAGVEKGFESLADVDKIARLLSRDGNGPNGDGSGDDSYIPPPPPPSSPPSSTFSRPSLGAIVSAAGNGNKEFCSQKLDTVFQHGVWYIVFTSGNNCICCDKSARCVLRVFFGSNGWFDTDGPSGPQTHWSSGGSSKGSNKWGSATAQIQHAAVSGSALPLKAPLSHTFQGWSVDVKSDGFHMQYDHPIVLNYGSVRATHRGSVITF